MTGTPPTSVHGGTVALLAVARPLRCGTARKSSSELPHRATDLTRKRASETRQDIARSVVAKLSVEVGATLANDSRRTAASHLGRAYAGAYRGDGECAGVLGVEFGALVRRAAGGGAFSGNGTRQNCCAAAARTEEGGRRRGRRNGGSGLGTRGGVPTRGRGWSAAALPTLAYGHHVAVVGWGEAGAARGRERGGGGRSGCWLGRKGGGVSAAAPVSFSFFLKFFSQFLSKFIWTV